MIPAVVAALGRGEVVGLPTDTVYGVAADPFSESAVAALFEVKRRPGAKPIPILAADAAALAVVAVLDDTAIEAARDHWPGPLTLVVARVAGLPDWVGDPESGSVAVRVPAHPAALEVLHAFGPLAVTSANRSGESPAHDHVAAGAIFGEEVACYLPGAGGGGEPSTIVDLTSAPGRVIRAGPVPWPG